MGLEQVSEQGGISPSGESAETSIPNRSIWRLHWFVDKLLHLHLPFSLPSIDEIKQIIGRGILTAGAVGTPFLGVTPQAYAEGQPGVKREGITDTFNPASEPNGINIELGEDGVPEVYVPSQESTIIVVDGNPVEASGVRAGGEPSSSGEPRGDEENISGQGGGEVQPELPYLKRFTNADGSIIFNNTGNEVGLTIGDAALLEEVFTPLARKFRPNGVEFFFPSLEDYVKQQTGNNRVQDRLTDLKWNFLPLSAYPGSFLQDTGIIVGQRKDGVTEIYIGLSVIPGANSNIITEAQKAEMSKNLANEGLIRYMVGEDKYATDPEVRELLIKWGKKGYEQFKMGGSQHISPLLLTFFS